MCTTFTTYCIPCFPGKKFFQEYFCILFAVLAVFFFFLSLFLLFSGCFVHTVPKDEIKEKMHYPITNAEAQSHAGLYAIRYISGATFSSAITRLIVRSKSFSSCFLTKRHNH